MQTRAFERNDEGKAMAVRFATIDSTVALLFAFFINAAILIVSAATFHGTEHADVADISDAYQAADARAWARRWPARCLRWRCWPRARTRR